MRKNSLPRVRRLNFVRPTPRSRILIQSGRIMKCRTARWNLRRPVSAVGLFFRLNPGNWVTVQAEANVSIGSVWDSVDAQGDFVNSSLWMFQNISDVNFSVPIMAGVRLLDFGDMFTLRVLAGPEFYTSIKSIKNKEIDFSKYSLSLGLGIDLFNVIAVDGRIMRYSDGNMVYKLGVGLIF